MSSEDAKEELGQAIDSLDNCTYGLINMPMLPDRIHVEGLRGSLPAIISKMKTSYTALTGENPWEEVPQDESLDI